MSKKSKSRVRGVAIFIVLLALAITTFNVYKRISHRVVVDTKDADNIYRSTTWMYKAKYITSPKDGKVTKDKATELISKMSTEPVVYQNVKPGVGAYIFKVDNTNIPLLEKNLSTFASISNNETITDSSLVATSIDIEKQRLTSYQNERATLDGIRLRSDAQNRRMDVLNRQIEITQDRVQRLEASGSTLVYLVIRPSTSGQSPVDLAKYGVMNFILALAILCLATLVLYFGTKLLTFLLALMGVKGFGLGGALQNYTYRSYSNYTGRYGYGYGGKNRKVKRIYKDKRSTPTEDDNDSSEN